MLAPDAVLPEQHAERRAEGEREIADHAERRDAGDGPIARREIARVRELGRHIRDDGDAADGEQDAASDGAVYDGEREQREDGEGGGGPHGREATDTVDEETER